ncbi:MAG: hypothetical protein LBG77_02990, partial [Dysgonamonadaceae bacterium]|nr:hypothetical protein [Dysgonamonadaceae bacterium]
QSNEPPFVRYYDDASHTNRRKSNAGNDLEFMKEHNSPLGIKISTLPYKENEKVINLPLYNTAKLEKII